MRRISGRFIARANGKVLASGTTYRGLLQAIRKHKLNRRRVIVGYVPPKGAICIYPVEEARLASFRRDDALTTDALLAWNRKRRLSKKA